MDFADAVPAAAPVTSGDGPAPVSTANGKETEPAVTGPSVPGPSATGSSDTQELWTRLCARVAKRKPMLGSFLEHGAPTSIDAEALSAVFENDYYEGMVTRRENLVVIHEELAVLCGRPTQLRAKVGALPIGARSASRGTASDDPDSASAAQKRSNPRDLLDDNPGLKRAIHELGGQLLPGGS